MISCIIASSILLAAEDYHERTNYRNATIRKLDWGLTGMFVLEAVLLIVVRGLVLHKGSYLRSGWNVLDIFVVVTSIIGLVVSSDDWGVRPRPLPFLCFPSFSLPFQTVCLFAGALCCRGPV